MSLDLYLNAPEGAEVPCVCTTCDNKHTRTDRPEYFRRNITHNLGGMFDEAGVYEILWRGDGLVAKDVLPKLAGALATMRAEPDRFKAFNAENGWGTYDGALAFLSAVVRACEEFPEGVLRCCR